MDKKPLDLETMRLRIGRALYNDTFKDDGGPAWLTIPTDVRAGFVRMVGVMFNALFEEDPTELARFFVDEGLNKEEFDLIVLQARQQGKTFREMQQQNAFVQRSALFTMCEDMLRNMEDMGDSLEGTPEDTDAIAHQLNQYADALAQIKEAADPVKIRENAVLVAGEKGKWPAGDAQVATLEGTQVGPSGILGADGKPMTPSQALRKCRNCGLPMRLVKDAMPRCAPCDEKAGEHRLTEEGK